MPGLVELMTDIETRKVRVVEVETVDAVAVRPLAAVRLRRHVPLRGRLPAGRAPGRGPGAGLHPAGRAARAGRPARAARRRRGGDRRGRAAAPDRGPPGPRPRGRRRPAAGARARSPPPRCWSAAATRTGWPPWRRPAGPSGSASPATSTGPPSRTPAGCATPWARRCRSAIPEAFIEPVADPLGDLVARYARTHGPFAVAEVAARFGLGVAVARGALGRLAAAGRVVEGEFRPGGSGTEWCDAEVLRRLRRLSLARCARRSSRSNRPRSRGSCRPGSTSARTRCAASTACCASSSSCRAPRCRPPRLERLVLPARVVGYSPAMLDELTAAGEVLWAGHGSLPGDDGWVSLHLPDTADLLLPAARPGDRGRRPAPRRCSTRSATGTRCSSASCPTGSRLHRRHRAGRRPSGTWSGPGGSPTTPSPRCAR